MKQARLFVLAMLMLSGCLNPERLLSDPTQILGPSERIITLLQTNDIHGSLEPHVRADGRLSGGMAIWGGVVNAIRRGMADQYADHAGVLVLDAGDQFQGTLLSNYNEGRLVFDAMSIIQYDAVVPGNHDYDFGPEGWLDDRISPKTLDQDSRGVIKKLAKRVRFPLLSANTYFKDSVVDITNKAVQVSGSHCSPTWEKDPSIIDWTQARRPDFLQPYLIKEVAGVRVAMIGLDNPGTPATTTVENVEDLCFRDEYETYMELRKTLEGQADIFVLVMHNGNSNIEFSASKLVEKLARLHAVDAVVAGHTHFVNEKVIDGVPMIQSKSNGEMFGRIDLVWDVQDKKLVRSKMRLDAGISMPYGRCADKKPWFCTASEDKKSVYYEGVLLQPDSKIEAIIAEQKSDPVFIQLSEMKLGVAEDKIEKNRISESPLANALSDAVYEIGKEIYFPEIKGGDVVAMINTGGIREDIPKGEINYSDLFNVLPFNNYLVLSGPTPVRVLLALIKRSINTCGNHGALMQSGLRIQFSREGCPSVGENKGKTGSSPKAKLLRVETVRGELIYDGSIKVPENREFWIVTLDFLSEGGSGYTEFLGVPRQANFTEQRFIFREALKDYYLKTPAKLQPRVDGRWLEVPAESRSVADPKRLAAPAAIQN